MKNCLIIYFLLSSFTVFAQSTEIKYLSGTDAAHTVTWDFFCSSGRRSGSWQTIQVPSCWEQQGFGHYDYGRDYKTNGKNFRFSDEKGTYKYNFQIPLAWKNKTVDIVFEGSMTDTEVKINGKSAGAVHRGAFYRFTYTIDSLLLYGKMNTLEVQVSKMSSDVSVNNAERLADYWVFGGIFRPVYLIAKPKQQICAVQINALHTGKFSLRADVVGGKKIRVSITDIKGNQVGTIEKDITHSTNEIEASFPQIKAWTAETPHLYNAKINLLDAFGKSLHEVQERFGFRTIEIRKGDGIYINGTQVKFKGVNRHCFWPETGRTLSREQQLMDVQLIKEMNMNAVRCSHYPPDKYFLELCDSLGLYVLDELAGWQKAYSTAAGAPLVKEMVERDRNHPSIIFWSNGNEGGTNKALDELYGKWDLQKRPVIHAHHRPGNDFNGIDCNHYEDYNSTAKILNDSLIYMPTEFLHAQDDGGGAAGMEDMWALHWRSKRSGGGFIWVFTDEAIMRTDMNNALDANGLNANDGILGPHREKEGSYYALKEIFSPIHLIIPNTVRSDAIDLPIENRYHFTDLSSCRLRKEWVKFSSPFSRTAGFDVLHSRTDPLPHIAPGEKSTLHIDLQGPDLQGPDLQGPDLQGADLQGPDLQGPDLQGADLQGPDLQGADLQGADLQGRVADALILSALDQQGNTICKWTIKLQSNTALIKPILSYGRSSPVAIKALDSTIEMTGGDMTIVLDHKTGLLKLPKNKTNDFQLSFKQGPILTAGNGNLVHTKLEQDKVIFEYDGSLRSLTWSIASNGWVRLDYVYAIKGAQPFNGISFQYPENYMLGSRWLGKGPSRQWKNRMAGTPISVWQNLYNNSITGYNPVQYPEFKGYFGEISWMEFNTVEGKFYVATPDSGMFVRLFHFSGLTSTGQLYPSLPSGDISFLDGIPAIGSKLAMGITGNAAVYGPMGALNPYKGVQSRTLYFYFGMPKLSNKEEKYTRPLIDNVF